MCKFCKTTRKKYGYCVRCGKEICGNCASKENIKIHKEHPVFPYKYFPPSLEY